MLAAVYKQDAVIPAAVPHQEPSAAMDDNGRCTAKIVKQEAGLTSEGRALRGLTGYRLPWLTKHPLSRQEARGQAQRTATMRTAEPCPTWSKPEFARAANEGATSHTRGSRERRHSDNVASSDSWVETRSLSISCSWRTGDSVLFRDFWELLRRSQLDEPVPPPAAVHIAEYLFGEAVERIGSTHLLRR